MTDWQDEDPEILAHNIEDESKKLLHWTKNQQWELAQKSVDEIEKFLSLWKAAPKEKGQYK